MFLSKWTLILGLAAVLAAVLGFFGVVAGALAVAAKALFWLLLAALAAALIVGFLSYRKRLVSEVEPLGPRRSLGETDPGRTV